MGRWERFIKTAWPCSHGYAFDRVTVCDKAGPVLSFLGVIWSEYASGPGLFTLADAAAEHRGPGFYGLQSCRSLGYRPKIESGAR